MTEHSVNDLSYGHFGQLIYDTEQHEWLSSRHTTKGEGLKALGVVKTYVTSETVGRPDLRRGQSKSKNYGNGYLYRKLPVMGMVAPEELTQLVAETEQPGFDHKDDWKILERVVHAKLRVWDQQGRRHNVLVFPGGAAGSILKTIVLRDARQGWGIDRSNSAWLRTLDLKEVNSTSWQADGNIRQICFATNYVDEPHPLLAFRTPRSITVVSPRIPVLQDTTSHATIADDHATTRIHLEQVLKLGVEAMNGAEFVDLSFNPWFPTTLAAVTEHGRWYLRTLLSRLHTVEYSENLDGYFGDFDEDDAPDDRWHRILWTSNSTFIICNRNILKAYRRQGQIVTCINADVLASQSTIIIIDLKRSPTEDSCIFITTATHIIYLRVNRDLRNSEAKQTFSILLSWRHNRSTGDKTLRMSFIEEEEGMLF
jgi:RNA polymerase I-specific transcription initiation factor RRN6